MFHGLCALFFFNHQLIFRRQIFSWWPTRVYCVFCLLWLLSVLYFSEIKLSGKLKLNQLTDNVYKVAVNWKTKKVKNLFSLKSRNPHPSCKIYLGVCSCNETYIGETKRNVGIRWGEHDDSRKSSEPAKHLKENPDHTFSWSIIMNASTNARVRKNLEASWVALKKPTLNNQVDSKKLILFRHGVTWIF